MDFPCDNRVAASMAQDATKNLPNLTTNENLLDQVQSAAGHDKSQDASFLAQVTGNPFFTAVGGLSVGFVVGGHD